MKNGKMMRSLAAMSLVVALFAAKSHATYYSLTAGTYTVVTHQGGVCQNPNGYPVVTLASSTLANGLAGFLLDGSESASNWLKMLQDAALNNRRVIVYTDDTWANAFCGTVASGGYTGGAYPILAISVMP